jgi:hypothetical protein
MKISPNKKIYRRPTRPRHCFYSLKNEGVNSEINNTVKEECNNYLENWRLDMDEAIASISVHGKHYQEMLAQVNFKTNPSEGELRKLKIKIPQTETNIDVYLQTLEGNKVHGEIALPELDEK